MPDYKKGQIYRLWSPHTDKFYIGSTCSPLSKRMYNHRTVYNQSLNGSYCTTASQLFNLGFDDVKIELIELYPCNSKSELDKREGELIRQHKNNLVNHCIPGRTHKEWEWEYRRANLDKFAKKTRDYRAAKKTLLAAQEILVSTT